MSRNKRSCTLLFGGLLLLCLSACGNRGPLQPPAGMANGDILTSYFAR